MQNRYIQRRIDIAGLHNLRDTGGYATLDGGITRFNTLFRSDSPHRLNNEGVNQLSQLAIKTAIDLRFVKDITHKPHHYRNDLHVRYHHVELHPELITLKTTRPYPLPQTLGEYYRSMLVYNQAQIRRVFEIMGSPNAFPTLINCTLGKDRTGIVVALALGVARVPIETILEDYELSGGYIQPLTTDMLAQFSKDDVSKKWAKQMLACDPNALHFALEWLFHEYGNAGAYLREIGVSHTAVSNIRAALVEI